MHTPFLGKMTERSDYPIIPGLFLPCKAPHMSFSWKYVDTYFLQIGMKIVMLP
jgi:hypothetical protein